MTKKIDWKYFQFWVSCDDQVHKTSSYYVLFCFGKIWTDIKGNSYYLMLDGDESKQFKKGEVVCYSKPFKKSRITSLIDEAKAKKGSFTVLGYHKTDSQGIISFFFNNQSKSEKTSKEHAGYEVITGETNSIVIRDLILTKLEKLLGGQILTVR